MRHWITRSLITSAILTFSFCLTARSLAAQAVDESRLRHSGDGGRVPDPGGKDAGGPAPRLADGTPNLERERGFPNCTRITQPSWWTLQNHKEFRSNLGPKLYRNIATK